MKTEKNIFVAFILNLFFAICEFAGGILTGSVAITSDALHDFGDAVSIGFAWVLERKSKRQADNVFTFGYQRYSVVASLLTTAILLVGSVLVVVNAVEKIANPTPVDYDGMIIFAICGVVVNGIAAFFTHKGNSLNQKSVNLHMIEDVLGWIVVLVGAIVMRFTNLWIIDPLMSIGVAVFILVNAIKCIVRAIDVILEKAPKSLNVQQVIQVACTVQGVVDAHHVHVWTLDGQNHCVTMHVVVDGTNAHAKSQILHKLEHCGVVHASIEVEHLGEPCNYQQCRQTTTCGCGHHHGHHH